MSGKGASVIINTIGIGKINIEMKFWETGYFMTDIIEFLLERFKIEQKKRDRSGIYGYTQRTLAYNSNKIEGSTLTEEQTASLFEHGMLPQSDDYYRAKDVEEMNGHFLMFNKMLDTLDESLTEELIKRFHYELKAGVFEDRANGYAIGDYKKRPNMVGMYETVSPKDIADEMKNLLEWYCSQEKNLDVLAEFHARYEIAHPFQDGNGRTGRIILFRECLVNRIIPVVIHDNNRMEYIDGINKYRIENKTDSLVKLMKKEQQSYEEMCRKFM